MATGNYGRVTDLRVRMAYAAMTSADPEAAQLALHGGEHVDALHRVMHDPGASGVNYDKIRSWLSKAARVADSRGVDPDAAVQWAMLRSSDGSAALPDGVDGARAGEHPSPSVTTAGFEQARGNETATPNGIAFSAASNATAPSVQPGWYVPEGREGLLRWWDGNQWTDATRPLPPPSTGSPPLSRSTAPPGHEALADRGGRFVALLLDWALLYAVPGPLYLIVDAILAENPASQVAGELETVATLLALVGWGLFWVFSAARSGRTWGKAVVGITTVHHGTGKRLSAGLTLWRELLRLFGSLSLLDALFIFRDDRRTLHDLLSDSAVVTAPKTPNPIEFFSREVLGR